jgi:hypothetical protein
MDRSYSDSALKYLGLDADLKYALLARPVRAAIKPLIAL